jgi:hypothetical protein
MQLPTGNYLGQSLIQEGMLLRFSPLTIFGKNTTNHHFGVVVSANHTENSIGLIVGTTSNVSGATSYAASRGLSPNTIVVIGGGTHPHFGKQTAFNCNDPKQIHMNQLVIWYQAGLIEVMRTDPFIDQSLLVDIKTGVNDSDLVSDRTKRLLF